MTRLLAVLALLLSFGIMPAHADELRPGYIAFTQTSAQDWRLIWKAPLRGGITARTQPILPRGCRFLDDPAREIGSLALISTWHVRCTGEVAGQSIGLSGLAASRTDVLVRVAMLGRPVQALRLTASQPSAMIAVRAVRLQVAVTYFEIGTRHILFGYDHLLFVLGLVLLLSGGWTIAKTVTAFTLAHSLTLIGTTLGLIGLPQRPVEAIIALSILFLAVEIVKKQPGEMRLSERWPWIVAFVFGLLHGFGFAGALAEIGLPEGEVPTALFTFNLGVEAGQLVIVVAALVILALVKLYASSAYALSNRLAAYGIGSLASAWLFQRILQ